MEYVIGIGSNCCRAVNMQMARVSLLRLFPDIRFSHEEETQPLYLNRMDLFSNQLACFVSVRPLAEVERLLKEIETAAGRLPDDKQKEIVKLDLDILRCGDCICRNADWERDYVQRGLKELGIA